MTETAADPRTRAAPEASLENAIPATMMTTATMMTMISTTAHSMIPVSPDSLAHPTMARTMVSMEMTTTQTTMA